MKITFITSNRGKLKEVKRYAHNIELHHPLKRVASYWRSSSGTLHVRTKLPEATLQIPDLAPLLPGLKPWASSEVCEVVHRNIHYPEIQAETLEEVAVYGMEYISKVVRDDFIIEDSGFFIKALNNFPGVYSAQVFRTIGCKGILKLMRGVNKRDAMFKSVIGFWDGKGHLFKGVVHGKVAHSIRGSYGFGYDPIFIPHNLSRTFGEMDIYEKNKISHRALALKKLFNFLKIKYKL